MSATPEEKALIRAALHWQRRPRRMAVGDPDRELLLAAQAVRISRRRLEGPAPIPCMERAEHSAVMFCHLPKGHEGSEIRPARPGWDWAFTHHEGVAANNNGVRGFRVDHQLINGAWERVNPS